MYVYVAVPQIPTVDMSSDVCSSNTGLGCGYSTDVLTQGSAQAGVRSGKRDLV